MTVSLARVDLYSNIKGKVNKWNKKTQPCNWFFSFFDWSSSSSESLSESLSLLLKSNNDKRENCINFASDHSVKQSLSKVHFHNIFCTELYFLRKTLKGELTGHYAQIVILACGIGGEQNSVIKGSFLGIVNHCMKLDHTSSNLTWSQKNDIFRAPRWQPSATEGGWSSGEGGGVRRGGERQVQWRCAPFHSFPINCEAGYANDITKKFIYTGNIYT